MALKYKQFVVKDVSQIADDEIECIIATSDVDRDGEILNIAGLDTKNFEANPVVLWAHNYWDLPVGKCVSLVKNATELIGRIKFAVAEYDLAATVCKLYKGGYLSAVSIGFVPSEGMWNPVKEAFEFTVSEMLEFSCVPVPANANALVTAKSAGIDTGVISHYSTKDPEDMFVCGDSGLPLAHGNQGWDGAAAAKRIAEWAGGPDKDKIDWAKYAKGFVICDKDIDETFGAYKLPFADIIDGELEAVPTGIEAVAGVLQGARGGVNAPSAVQDKAKAFIADYYKKMDKTPPWENSDKSVHAKSGATLSGKNLKSVQAAHTHLTKVLMDAGCDMGDTPIWPSDPDPEGDVGDTVEDDSATTDNNKHVSHALKPHIQSGQPAEKLVSRLAKQPRRIKYVLPKKKRA